MKSIQQMVKGTVPNMTLVSEGNCSSCQQPTKTYETTIIGGPNKGQLTKITYGCKCEDIKLAAAAVQAHKSLMSENLKSHFDKYSLINPKLLNATMDNFIPKNELQDKAKRISIRYIEIFNEKDSKNLVFTGTYGVGKSHLSKSIADGVIQKGFSAIFISVPKLLRKIRSTYNNESDINENDIFEMLEKVDLLVLDDIGAEKQSEWASERLFDLIDSRQGMNTIYTTNYVPEALFDLFGERNASRIVNEDTTIIEMQGVNHRLADLQKDK